MCCLFVSKNEKLLSERLQRKKISWREILIVKPFSWCSGEQSSLGLDFWVRALSIVTSFKDFFFFKGSKTIECHFHIQ